MENYQVICMLLCLTLRETRQYSDLESLDYAKKGEGRYVIARFVNGGYRKINVTADSGIAMIKDILKYL